MKVWIARMAPDFELWGWEIGRQIDVDDERGRVWIAAGLVSPVGLPETTERLPTERAVSRRGKAKR